MVFLTGEAGIGKTTLVDAFVAQVAVAEEVWLGQGQCIEQYGAGEAYLPVLEALGAALPRPGSGPSPDAATCARADVAGTDALVTQPR